MNNAPLQRVEDRLHYVVGSLDHVVVPKVDHPKALSFKPSGTSRVQSVGPVVAMRVAVDFNHQLRAEADEIDDVPANRVLTSELESLESMCAKSRPQALLGCCLISAQLACSIDRGWITSHHTNRV